MQRRAFSLLAVAALFFGITAAAPASFGPPWISIEYPPSPYDQTTRNAFLLVHTFHHGTPTVTPLTGKAEGIVGGERKSVTLRFTGTSRTGVYALAKQWQDNGTWVLFLTASQGPNDGVTAVVELGADGRVASVRVPTNRRGSHDLPAEVSAKERDRILQARVAMNEAAKGSVASRP